MPSCRGYPLPPEIRSRDENGKIRIEHPSLPARTPQNQTGFRRTTNGGGQSERGRSTRQISSDSQDRDEVLVEQAAPGEVKEPHKPVRVYPYGVARNRLAQASKRLGVPVVVVDDAGEADLLVTLRSYYRDHQRPIIDAEHRGIPIYVLRANTINQMQQFLGDVFNLAAEPDEEPTSEPALQETQAAINAVLNGERWVELPPATAYIRRLQHQMARQANLTSHSYGKEPRRRVRIFRD